MSVLDDLTRFPEGWSLATHRGVRWGVTIARDAGGGHVRLYAEELGGTGVVSANVYVTTAREVHLRPCEMPEADVRDFLTHAVPLPADHSRFADGSRATLDDRPAGEPSLPDFVRAPNIAGDRETYELENEAIARDGRLDAALREVADWTGRRLLDVGCGTGFWLLRYGVDAAAVLGIEPDPDLLAEARDRVADLDHVDVGWASAEHLATDDIEVDDDVFDVAHARFAYFWGAGGDAGLAEVGRVLRPDGTLVVIDNHWGWGEFAGLLDLAWSGNAAVDPDATERWWRDHGAEVVDVRAGWQARSPAELERILRLEFPTDVVDTWLTGREPSSSLTYGYRLFVRHP